MHTIISTIRYCRRKHDLWKIGRVFGMMLIIFTGLTCVYIERRLSFEDSKENDVADTWARLSGPLPQDNTLLLALLRDHFLDPPSPLPYNFSKNRQDLQGMKEFSYPWINEHLREIFDVERHGFFVEAGALNGEYLSNTLWLETDRNWTGLLIEPDPVNYGSLVQKHRKAWTSNTCISPENYPKRTVFVSRFSGDGNGLYEWAHRGNSHEMREDLHNDGIEGYLMKSFSEVQCFPLVSYLLALNVSRVDLLSLDIQGTEELVLKNLLKTDKVQIRVIVAEDMNKTLDLEFMKNMGYSLIDSAMDHIFVKSDDYLLKTNKRIFKRT